MMAAQPEHAAATVASTRAAPADVLLIMPCFNEAGSIAALLQEARALEVRFDTLVIDDGSSDATYEEARRHSRCVRLIQNLGIGGAVQTGVRYARDAGYSYCVQVDGDGQHPPAEVIKLLQCQARSGAHVVIGSRYLRSDGFRSTRARRAGSRLIGLALRSLFGGTRVTDPTSGLRLFDRTAMVYFAARYPHDFPEPISLAWALRDGMTVAETPVVMRAREHGASSIAGLKALAYMIRVLAYIFLARLDRPAARGKA